MTRKILKEHYDHKGNLYWLYIWNHRDGVDRIIVYHENLGSVHKKIYNYNYPMTFYHGKKYKK